MSGAPAAQLAWRRSQERAVRPSALGQVPGDTADYTSYLSDPNVPADLKTRLSAAVTPSGTGAIVDLGGQGITAVAGGQAMTPDEIQGGFALGSAGALALGAGMSLSAAVPVMAPIAAVVFGGGAGISALMHSVFGIDPANTSQIYACTPGDTSNGTSPSDPKWKHSFSPSLYDSFGQGQPPSWLPATQGKFETWARPILMRGEDGYLNCQPPPGVQQIPADQLQQAVSSGDLSGVGKLNDYYDALWQLGVIKAWNDANPDAPTRQVALDPTIPFGDPRGQDVIQQMLWRFRRTLTAYASEYASGAPISITVADPSPEPKLIAIRGAIRGETATSAPTPTSTAAPTSAASTAGLAIAGLGLAGFVAAGIVSWATGKTLDAVFDGVWRKVRGKR